MKKPKPDEDVIVRWLDSGLNEESCDPTLEKNHMLVIVTTHGRVVRCKPSEFLCGKLPKTMDSTVLQLTSCYSEDIGTGKPDKDVTIHNILWSNVVSIRVWPKKKE